MPKLNDCTICGEPIVLIPTAAERSKQDQGRHPPSYYRNIFTAHSACTIEKRSNESKASFIKSQEEREKLVGHKYTVHIKLH